MTISGIGSSTGTRGIILSPGWGGSGGGGGIIGLGISPVLGTTSGIIIGGCGAGGYRTSYISISL